MNSSGQLTYSSIHESARLSPKARIEDPIHMAPQSEVHSSTAVGRFCVLNFRSVIYQGVEMGRYCSVGRGCEIGVAHHPLNYLSIHGFQWANKFPNYPGYTDVKKVKHKSHVKTVIGHDVWIGAQAIITGGVTIGTGAVIAANATVTKDVEPYAIVGGTPAKIIKFRFDDLTIKRLLATTWWELPLEEISQLPFDSIDDCLKILEASRIVK
jgi:virginiamycin A acetyltransferase